MHLHYAIPIIPRGNAKKCEESHAKILEMGMFAEAIAWMFFGTFCGEKGNIMKIMPFLYSPNLPNNSTPRAAKMKKRRKKREPRLPTWGKASPTVSKRDRMPLAILSNFRTGKR
jgi:hypothetical protein